MNDLRPTYYYENRDRLDGNRLVVYNTLCQVGRATAKELAHRLGWEVTSVRPRLTELKDRDLISPTGIRRNGEHEFTVISVRADSPPVFRLEFCHA